MEKFFYFIQQGKYFISDVDACNKSERTFDMKFYDLANNEPLLNKLGLYYIQGSFLNPFSYEKRAKWFLGYLSSFSLNKDIYYEKLLKNPTVKILLEDEKLLESVKEYMKIDEIKKEEDFSINKLVEKFKKEFPTPYSFTLTKRRYYFADFFADWLQDEKVDFKEYYQPIINILINQGYAIQNDEVRDF